MAGKNRVSGWLRRRTDSATGSARPAWDSRGSRTSRGSRPAGPDPQRDTLFTMGPVDVLDHSSRAFTYGSKMGIDATRKFSEEGFTREWPDVIEMNAATKAKVDAMWSSLGIPAASP